MSNWSDFLRTRLDQRGWDAARLATEAGVTPSIVSRWMSGAHKPTVDRVRAVADALGVPMIEAMIAADFISSKEAKVDVVAPDLRLLSDQQLIRELARRLGDVAEKPVDAGDPGDEAGSPGVDEQPRWLLAAQVGETAERQLHRTQRSPEDFPDPDGPEDGA